MLRLSEIILPQKDRVVEDILTHGHRDQSRTNVVIDELLGGNIYQPKYEKRNDWDDVESFFQNKVKRVVSNIWGISYEDNTGCKLHDHKGNKLSAIYYMRIGEDAGALVFPEIGVTIQPKENQFVEFSPHLLHGVEPSHGRVCLAMNFGRKL